MILKKIQKNGLHWLYKRLKFELVSPKFYLSIKFVKLLEVFRKLLNNNLNTLKDNFVSDNTLIAVYDLNTNPITYDFSFFLAEAETFGRVREKLNIFIIIVQNDSSGLNDKTYDRAVSNDSKLWRLNNILLQLIDFYPACVGHLILPIKSDINFFTKNNLVYPLGYSEKFKPLRSYKEVFPILNKGQFSGFKSSKTGLSYVNQWLKSNNVINQIVVITLRQYDYDVVRNSNIIEWSKFAKWVKLQAYTPIFIPDTDSCWFNNKQLDEFLIFTEPCWNIGLRIALYELAFVNFFYSNGTGAICLMNKNTNYIVMNPIIEDSLHAKSQVYEDYGLTKGQRRYDFAKKYQLLSWKRDTFENIRDEFLEFKILTEE
jgi:hypothetical protein